jgi:hypothetical protein
MDRLQHIKTSAICARKITGIDPQMHGHIKCANLA